MGGVASMLTSIVKGPPKPAGPSAEQLKAQADAEAAAKRAEEMRARELKIMEEQKLAAEKQSKALQAEEKKRLSALKRKQTGALSLVGSAGERGLLDAAPQ